MITLQIVRTDENGNVLYSRAKGFDVDSRLLDAARRNANVSVNGSATDEQIMDNVLATFVGNMQVDVQQFEHAKAIEAVAMPELIKPVEVEAETTKVNVTVTASAIAKP